MLKHGENIVDLMGGEIDRIEMKLRVRLNYYHILHILFNCVCVFLFSSVCFRKNSQKSDIVI